MVGSEMAVMGCVLAGHDSVATAADDILKSPGDRSPGGDREEFAKRARYRNGCLAPILGSTSLELHTPGRAGLAGAKGASQPSAAAQSDSARPELDGAFAFGADPDILSVVLNVNLPRNGGADPGDEQPAGQPVDRATLERELLDEMTGWSPRDRGGVFKSWHRHALSLVHLNVLTALEAEGPLSMRRLAEAMDVSDASATGIVDRMEKRGLVERIHDTDDRRVVLVHPTETGRQVFVDMAAHQRQGLSKILGELTAEEVAALLVGMRAIHAARRRVFPSPPDPADAAGSEADRASSITRNAPE